MTDHLKEVSPTRSFHTSSTFCLRFWSLLYPVCILVIYSAFLFIQFFFYSNNYFFSFFLFSSLLLLLYFWYFFKPYIPLPYHLSFFLFMPFFNELFLILVFLIPIFLLLPLLLLSLHYCMSHFSHFLFLFPSLIKFV